MLPSNRCVENLDEAIRDIQPYIPTIEHIDVFTNLDHFERLIPLLEECKEVHLWCTNHLFDLNDLLKQLVRCRITVVRLNMTHLQANEDWMRALLASMIHVTRVVILRPPEHSRWSDQDALLLFLSMLSRLPCLEEINLPGSWLLHRGTRIWQAIYQVIPRCSRLKRIAMPYLTNIDALQARAERSQSLMVRQLLVLLIPLTHPRTRPGKFLLVEHVRMLESFIM